MTPERFQKLKRVLDERQPDLTVLADGIHKPHNVSAVLRSCDAVGIHRLHAVSASGALRRHHMTSGGSKRWVDVVVHRSMREAIEALKSDGWRLLAAHPAPNALDFRKADYTQRVAIVLGAELQGLSPLAIEEADASIAIPMHGMVASLNVSVAAAVILFEAQRQRHAAGLYDHSRLSQKEYAQTLFEWAYPEIARRCRRHGLPYPELTDDGRLARNPFDGASASKQRAATDQIP